MMADVFVILDNVQHQKRSYEHRNKIRTPDGVTWLSIPIDRKNSLTNRICDLKIADGSWQLIHLKSFNRFYKKTPYFDEIYPLLEKFYTQKIYLTLNSAAEAMLNILFDYFDLKPKLIWASNYELSGKNDDLLIEITKKFGGDAYISGPNGRDYIDESKFKQNNINLYYHDYEHPKYNQIWGDFFEYMTLWDMMFYYGKNTLDKIQSGILVESNYNLGGLK